MHQFYRSWRIISLKSEQLARTPQRRLCKVRCHTGPEVDLLLNERKGAANKKVTKKKGKKERLPCQPVLDCFDQLYSEELGDLWPCVRAALLDPHSWQYGVMLNRFSVATDVLRMLRSRGFSALLPQTDAAASHGDVPPPASSSDHPEGEDSPLPPSQSLPRPSLRCYVHPRPLRFPPQAHRSGRLKHYYLLNAASLLPVLALRVRDGEKVLDLCSAPGGKAVAIMQCATPALLCCNEPDPHRREWLAKTLESFLPNPLNGRVIVSAQDGRCFGQSEAGTYDKVLVDAPCSNDRSWLYSSSSQQGRQRLQERGRLPALQAQLLRSALSAVRPGGLVVYSTCTLSSSENYAVIETVLNDCPEAEPEGLWDEIAVPLSESFAFGPAHRGHGPTLHRPPPQPQNGTASSYHHRLGILVVPQPGKTWGPMFLSRIRRRK